MTSCRICSAACKLYAVKDGFEVWKCTKCGFGQVDVAPDVLASFYDQSYFNGEKASFKQEVDEPLSVARRYWIEDQMAKFGGRGPLKVLEIGPGLGGPIAGFFERERKQDRYAAIEFSDYAADALRKRGIEVWSGRVVEPATLAACRGQYDFIFGTEVIEHDLDPHGFLKAVHDMLKPHGRAAFTTGNLDGWMARGGKEKWYYLDPPAHVSFFTPRSAKKAMLEAGMVNFGATKYGFRHMELADKFPKFVQPAILWLTSVSNMSTGMTISAERPG